MPRKCSFLLTLLLLCGHLNHNVVLGARILALLGMASPSHHIWNRSLMLALARKGHHVTVVSPDSEKETVSNYRHIILEDIYEKIQSAFNYESFVSVSNMNMIMITFDWGEALCNLSLQTKGAQQLMKLSNQEKFDLIIVEAALCDCFLAYISLFGYPPVIAVTGLGAAPWAGAIVGNPQNPSYMPSFLLPYTSNMTFIQRLTNFLELHFTLLYRQYVHFPRQDKIVRQHFGNSVPPLSELERKISLVLINTHYSLEGPQPLVPALIQVGGMHLKPAKPLPDDIQTFLDGAKDGAIYFSLGSNLRSDKMKAEKVQIFLDAFAELPQRVLWKWESDSLPGQPKNIKVGKWLPQNDILAHPNVRIFITHSGLLSTQESLYHGVPVIGMPFMVDQKINIEKLISRGLGEKLDYNNITKEEVLNVIWKVLSIPSYRENAKQQSAIFRDQIDTPLERAVYWTEYVIRHKGAPHIRSAALDLSLYQYLLLDVLAILAAGICAVIVILYITISKVLNICKGSKKPQKSKQH